MKYHYKCLNDCKLSDYVDSSLDHLDKVEVAIKSRLVHESEDGQIDLTSPFVFVVNHGMLEDPPILCPICEKLARRVVQKAGAVYIRGNGYLDIKGCRRDMNLHKLQTDDPYGYMRQPGEKDDLADRLRRGGKHQKNSQYFMPK